MFNCEINLKRRCKLVKICLNFFLPFLYYYLRFSYVYYLFLSFIGRLVSRTGSSLSITFLS